MPVASLPPLLRPPRRRRPRRQLPLLALLVVLGRAGPVPAASPTDPAPQPATVTSRAELRIQQRLMAPCCWAGTIDNHDSAIAAEMKDEIRRRLAAGESADAILAAFVARFGPRVLAEPPARGLDLFVYLLPVLALLGGAALVVTFLRRQVRAAAAPAAAAADRPADDGDAEAYARRVEQALRRADR